MLQAFVQNISFIFGRMLQVFYLDAAYISHICCKHMFQMFHLFQSYVVVSVSCFRCKPSALVSTRVIGSGHSHRRGELAQTTRCQCGRGGGKSSGRHGRGGRGWCGTSGRGTSVEEMGASHLSVVEEEGVGGMEQAGSVPM
jgi:hypothetical protein